MAWLSKHHAVIDCRSKVVVFRITLQAEFSIIGESKADRQVQQGKFGAVAGQRSVIPVEEAYSYVFLEESLRLPPKRVMEFFIDIIPDTTPISKAPHRMAHPELEILKEQIDEYLVRVHQAKYVTMGSTNNIGREEGRRQEDVR